MAISTRTNVLNIKPGSIPVTVRLSQGDVGNTVEFYLYDGSEIFYPHNYEVSVHGIRQDGVGFGPYVVNTFENTNKVSFEVTNEMTTIEGVGLAELNFTDDHGNSIGSSNFALLVEQGTFPISPIYDNSISVYQRILNYVKTTSAALSARMDEFTRLPDGSTTGDAELADIRVGGNDITYPTAGDATRGQYIELKDAINNDEVNAGYDILKNRYIANTGVSAANNGRIHSNFMFCPPGATVKFMGETNHSGVSALTFYDYLKGVIETVCNIGSTDIEYTRIAPKNTRYIRVSGKPTIKTYAHVTPTISDTLADILNQARLAFHIFIPTLQYKYACNFDTINQKIIFYGINRFTSSNHGFVEIESNTEYSYSELSSNFIYFVCDKAGVIQCKDSLLPSDVILFAFQKNYVASRIYGKNAVTLTVPYLVNNENINSNTIFIELTEDRTERLLLDDDTKEYIVNGNGYSIDLGIYLTGEKTGNLTVIPYTASITSYLYRVFISKELPTTAIRPNVYDCVIYAINSGVYTRLVPLLNLSDVRTTQNSFTYDGTNITINCARYDSIVLCDATLSCLDVRAGVKAKIKNVKLKHSHAGNFVSVNGANVSLENVTSIASGILDGFRCDYGESNFINCKAFYNGRDGFNFNFGDKSIVTGCEGSYNCDDGISHHSEGTTYVIDGCIFNNNAKGGISSPVLGAEGVAKNSICKNNKYGIYTYQTTKGLYSNIVTVGNEHRILYSNPVYLINCISNNDGADEASSTIEEYTV